MIVKTKKGYQVKSEKGKNLSKPYKKKVDAYKRLGEIDSLKIEYRNILFFILYLKYMR